MAEIHLGCFGDIEEHQILPSLSLIGHQWSLFPV